MDKAKANEASNLLALFSKPMASRENFYPKSLLNILLDMSKQSSTGIVSKEEVEKAKKLSGLYSDLLESSEEESEHTKPLRNVYEAARKVVEGVQKIEIGRRLAEQEIVLKNFIERIGKFKDSYDAVVKVAEHIKNEMDSTKKIFSGIDVYILAQDPSAGRSLVQFVESELGKDISVREKVTSISGKLNLLKAEASAYALGKRETLQLKKLFEDAEQQVLLLVENNDRLKATNSQIAIARMFSVNRAILDLPKVSITNPGAREKIFEYFRTLTLKNEKGYRFYKPEFSSVDFTLDSSSNYFADLNAKMALSNSGRPSTDPEINYVREILSLYEEMALDVKSFNQKEVEIKAIEERFDSEVEIEAKRLAEESPLVSQNPALHNEAIGDAPKYGLRSDRENFNTITSARFKFASTLIHAAGLLSADVVLGLSLGALPIQGVLPNVLASIGLAAIPYAGFAVLSRIAANKEISEDSPAMRSFKEKYPDRVTGSITILNKPIEIPRPALNLAVASATILFLGFMISTRVSEVRAKWTVCVSTITPDGSMTTDPFKAISQRFRMLNVNEQETYETTAIRITKLVNSTAFLNSPNVDPDKNIFTELGPDQIADLYSLYGMGITNADIKYTQNGNDLEQVFARVFAATAINLPLNNPEVSSLSRDQKEIETAKTIAEHIKNLTPSQRAIAHQVIFEAFSSKAKPWLDGISDKSRPTALKNYTDATNAAIDQLLNDPNLETKILDELNAIRVEGIRPRCNPK